MALGMLASYRLGGALDLTTVGGATALINTLSLLLAGALLGWLLASWLEVPMQRGLNRWQEWYGTLSPKKVISGTIGLIVALLLSVLASNLMSALPFYSWPMSLAVTLLLAGFFVHFSVQNADLFGPLMGNGSNAVRRDAGAKILDTNVIIDGRIVDLVRAGFLEGNMLVPGFVLRELQLLADHSDGQRRTRGKRGLEVLEQLRELRPLRVSDWDDPALDKVDDKLIRFARESGGKIVSNDNALSRIARLQDVEVVSIHEAAVALKPQVQAGDTLTITVTKGGQQQGQGIGFLEDGTMVVVDGGLKYKGQSVRVQVVNNVQTNVGRMIFAKLDDEAA